MDQKIIIAIPILRYSSIWWALLTYSPPRQDFGPVVPPRGVPKRRHGDEMHDRGDGQDENNMAAPCAAGVVPTAVAVPGHSGIADKSEKFDNEDGHDPSPVAATGESLEIGKVRELSEADDDGINIGAETSHTNRRRR